MEDAIRTKARDLGKYYDRIVRCEVTVEAPSQHHRQGSYHVRVELGVPGPDIVASRGHGDDSAYDDAYVAIRDAFRAAREELKSYVGRMRESYKGERIVEELNQ